MCQGAARSATAAMTVQMRGARGGDRRVVAAASDGSRKVLPIAPRSAFQFGRIGGAVERQHAGRAERVAHSG